MSKIRYKVVLLLLMVCPFVKGYAQKYALAKMNTGLIKQEVFSPMVNQSMLGKAMVIAGKKYSEGISVQAPSSGFLYVGKKGLKFIADVGVDDRANRNLNEPNIESIARTDGIKVFYQSANITGKKVLIGIGTSLQEIAPGSVVFTLIGDGKKIWSSGVMKQGDQAKHIDVDISGIAILNFTVSDAGDGISGDVANWINAYVTTSPGFVPQLVNENYNAKNNLNVLTEPLALALQKLPNYVAEVAKTDWLIQKPAEKAEIQRIGHNEIILSNGLASRTITISPNAATTSLKNLVTGEEFIRAVQPEAVVTIDGETYEIGGLAGQVNRGYLLHDWLKDMYSPAGSFQLSDITIQAIQPLLQWKAKRWLPVTQWEATGKELILSFTHPDKKGVVVKVHHKIYDNLPLVTKTISVTNNSGKEIKVNHFVGEIIAYPEKENFVSVPSPGAGWSKPNFYIENDYAFGGMIYDESDQSISWERDSAYTSQVNYLLQTPCIVKSIPKNGPSQVLQNGQRWQGFNTYTMLMDGTDRERNTLSRRKMYRALAPWVTENPIFMHLTSTKLEVVKDAVDQCVATGYEMIILSFGSGLNMENVSKENLDKYKMLADYAHSKGIEIGGYSLFSSRSIDPKNDVINIKTGKPGGTTFNNAPCLGSQWGISYLKKIQQFFEYTGFDLLEHDGPYPGDFCASKDHPGHKDYFDSQWNQWKQSTGLYQWMLAKDIYLNTPDFYMLNGANKTGIGYREVNWSLPRAEQIILGRQNLFDGTWVRTPSMGWTFVPLTEYQGGGAAATLEPLSEHLKEYAAHMQQNYGSGVQACYRGNRLYDTEATKNLVKENISHYKKYRDILNADIIHLRRPTGRDWDGILHADPLAKKEKGFAILYNPLDTPITTAVKLPLYYTGISNSANISIEGRLAKPVAVDKDGMALIEVTIPANGNTWMVVE